MKSLENHSLDIAFFLDQSDRLGNVREPVRLNTSRLTLQDVTKRPANCFVINRDRCAVTFFADDKPLWAKTLSPKEFAEFISQNHGDMQVFYV